jgi:hypothetical protein
MPDMRAALKFCHVMLVRDWFDIDTHIGEIL